MKQGILLTVTVGMAVLASLSARADVIFDNGAPDLQGAFISDISESWEQADDFSLVAGANVITDVHWAGIYIFGNTPMTDTFTIRVYGNEEGFLNDYPQDNPLHEFTGITGNRTTTTDMIGDFDLYTYSADITPLTLTAGTTYWISILNDTSNDRDDTWQWASSAISGGNEHYRYDGGSWNTVKLEDLSFSLTGPIIPEPTSMTLLGLGIAGLAFRMRRKNGQ